MIVTAISYSLTSMRIEKKVAERWRSQGVKALLHACVEPSEIPAIKSMADQFQELRYSVGVHPLDAHHWGPETLSVLKKCSS